jgi:hypothetical protein
MHDELRDALRRVDPPAGFADRVLERARVENVRVDDVRLKADATKVSWGWAVAATLIVALGSGAWYRTEERRRQEGEEAKRQVLLSLNIAGTKLRSIEMKVNNHEEGR